MSEKLDFKYFSKLVREALKDIKKENTEDVELLVTQWLEEIKVRII